MSERLLDRLLAAAPGDRIAVVRERWPAQREPLARVTGRVLVGLLTGKARWERVRSGTVDPDRLNIEGVSDKDEQMLERLLEHHGDGRVWLPFAPDFAVRVARRDSGPQHLLDFTGPFIPSGAARLSESVIRPVLDALLRPIDIACGEGSKSDRGRRAAWERSRDAHLTLGLRPGPPEDVAATLDDVAGALVRSWSHPPEDVGERVMALLCTWLAMQVQTKLGPDGAWAVADVVNQRTHRWLTGTVGTPEALGELLGARPRAATASAGAAVARSEPPFVTERLAVLCELWARFDTAQAEASLPEDEDEDRALRRVGARPTHWMHYFFDGRHDTLHEAEMRVLGPDLVASLERLWGARLPKSWANGRLETVGRPLQLALQILEPWIGVWNRLGVAAIWVADGRAVTFDQPQETHVRWVRNLAASPATIDLALIDELTALTPEPRNRFSLGMIERLGMTTEENMWLADAALRDPAELTAEERDRRDDLVRRYEAAQQALEDADVAAMTSGYRAMRDAITRHRRKWAEQHLDSLLDAAWRDMLAAAERTHADALASRGGRELTDRMFCSPAVLAFTNAWSGGLLQPVAELLGDPRRIEQEHRPVTRRDPVEVTHGAAAQLGLGPFARNHSAGNATAIRGHFALRNVTTAVLAQLETGGPLETPPRTLRSSTIEALREWLGAADGEAAWRRGRDAVLEELKHA